ncbi:hypothetical protein BX600DRAFT_477227 [Xylariales sp. PMI_506]|nr:hypothetical protein BX600DRAFT_477227 [Xylariales sp. PMI_506]
MFWSNLLLLPFCLAHPFLERSSPASTIRQLAQFPNDTWIENIDVRANGKVLVTLFTSPELYQIDPSQHDATPVLVARIPEVLGVLGIAEIEPDVFAITGGNLSYATEIITPESFSVWRADFRGQQDTAVVSKIADMPNATILNGMTTVRDGSEFVLIADSVGGVIWRLNLETAAYDVILNDTTTQPTAYYLDGGWGANGVHTLDGYLYYTNTNLGFYRVPIHDDGTVAGDVENLAEFIRGDDFTFDQHGNAIIARGAVDLIDKVTPAGVVIDLEYTNPDALVLIEGNTAVHFGRTRYDASTIYVSTNGGMSGLVNGTYVQGGRILAIPLGK